VLFRLGPWDSVGGWMDICTIVFHLINPLQCGSPRVPVPCGQQQGGLTDAAVSTGARKPAWYWGHRGGGQRATAVLLGARRTLGRSRQEASGGLAASLWVWLTCCHVRGFAGALQDQVVLMASSYQAGKASSNSLNVFTRDG
jgi:hypothetical protein